MVQAIRAVYRNGHIQLLNAVALTEGQEIQLFLLTDTEKFRSALGDLLHNVEDISDESLDEAALLKEIEDGFRGQPSLSRSIIDERWHVS